MTNIEFLLQRQSTGLLTEPAPSSSDLAAIIAAGMRVPDHGALKPWHFTVISGPGLKRLSELFVNSSDVDTANIEKITKMPFRAPMIIVVSTAFKEHSKVPKQEQLITSGCCVHAMQMAGVALGYGAMWRTGELAYNNKVKEGLSIAEQDELVGFLYIGTSTRAAPVKATKVVDSTVSYWQ